MIPQNRPATHPGMVLSEEFLKPMGISQNAFAAHLGWSHAKVNEIIHGRRGITPEAALSFADVLGTTPDLWLNMQQNHDLSKARQTHHAKKPLVYDRSPLVTQVGEAHKEYRVDQKTIPARMKKSPAK